MPVPPIFPLVREGSPGFDEAVASLERRNEAIYDAVEPAVRQIVDDVRHRGDSAVLTFADRLEGRRPPRILLRPYDGAGAFSRLPPQVAQALSVVASRIRRYSERQRPAGLRHEEGGVTFGEVVKPLRRVAICAPGSPTRSPMAVLMGAVPAQVAGVVDIVLCTSAPDDAMLAAAHLSGVTAVVDAGGAHGVAALAYGTETVPRVDKIVGDGDAYVALAKRIVSGDVGVDASAGPPELMVVADSSADAAIVAADLLACAERSETATAALLTTDERLAMAVERELERQMVSLPRRIVAQSALSERGLAMVVRSRDRLQALCDRLAFGAVALSLTRADEVAAGLRVGSSCSIGPLSPAVAGGYGSGPSSLTPQGGAARFTGLLSVQDFIVRSSFVELGSLGWRAQVDGATLLARFEGREALGRSLDLRRALPVSERPGGRRGQGGRRELGA